MKTHEERKAFIQKLRLAASEADDLLTSCDASDLLDGLEASRDFMFEASAVIEHLESRLAQVERERDALMKDFKMCIPKPQKACRICENREKPICADCERWDLFKWRGLCPENTKEEPQT